MLQLTVEDLTPEAIAALEVQCKAQAEKVNQLEEAMGLLQKELDDARKKYRSTSKAVQWRRLMAEVENDEDIANITVMMQEALADFYKTMQPPDDYDESREGISFCDTDDYADLTSVETKVDEFLLAIRRLVGENCASPEDDGDRRHQRRRALLMLLVLTINAARITDTPTEDAASLMEEQQDNIASLWQTLLHTDSGLVEAEKSEWKDIVSSFLGPPYDTST
ncbi:uncharacterized protein TEOVI_000162000 [Trypanosoma equiperdum]|uniref:Uncharacterized protein n=2 Tax=Trypanozoon TaxID=39700 RepID=Q580L7_TRYB2|nr:hypothetical protein, conserved [Trypanosoma brucei brucei TREU927]AAX79330.1 hypothetical protein, conserved [Trypanosoma brucei]AAZ10458.1 hypothetical protein, conserved [Trypanosoma brucei brucei TREU927]SCU70051.1 hypothetical protein, conserved [Trypanosoma equiperdum]